MTDRSVDVSPLFCGEHIRDRDLFSRFGGRAPAFQCVCLTRPEKMPHPPGADTGGGKEVPAGISVAVSGPDLPEMGPSAADRPLGLIVHIAGENLTEADKDVEAVVEKCLPDLLSEIKGVSHRHSRNEIDVRISKEAVAKGLDLKQAGAVLGKRLKEKFSFIDAIFIRILTDPEAVRKNEKTAREIYAERDKKALSLHDEDVGYFYFCRLCQNAAPNHVCVISPDRPSVCGTIGWSEAKAFEKADPEGPIAGAPKGRCLNQRRGEYDGVNAQMKKESGGRIERLSLYAAFDHPHTTGGSVDIIAFSIPESGGIGLLDRQSGIPAVNGLSFEELVAAVAGGRQIPGFQGVGWTYLRSPRFFQNEGGWTAVKWMTTALKERLAGQVPDETARQIEKIPTETDAPDMRTLKKTTRPGKPETSGTKYQDALFRNVRIRFRKAPEIEKDEGAAKIKFRMIEAYAAGPGGPAGKKS